MVRLMGLETENKDIETNLREIARGLLKDKKVDVIIGYMEGTLPMLSQPIIIDKEEEVDKLIWNNLCYVNLAKYLVPRVPRFVDSEKGNLTVGVVSKGCVGRALIHLASENKIKLDEIKIIGIPCNEKEIIEVSVSGNSIIVKGKDFEKEFSYDEYMNDLCKTCKIRKPPLLSKLPDLCVGECEEYSNIVDDFSDIAEFEALTPEEKWNQITEELSVCTRCYACREACPMCYCNLCFVDQNKPVWFGKTTDLPDVFVYHLIRAMHMAGRCVACGACSLVCPMGIDLNKINRKLEKIVKERFDFTSGLDPDVLPPMVDFKMDDAQEFMLEED